jgi:hypothetical protein
MKYLQSNKDQSVNEYTGNLYRLFLNSSINKEILKPIYITAIVDQSSDKLLNCLEKVYENFL